MKISAPNYTQTPNDLFDHWLPLLGEIELKVLLVIMRKTFGWHKKREKISLSQLEKLTGSCKTIILKAINELINKELILKEVIGENGMQVTYYELVIHDNSNNSYQCKVDTAPSVNPTPPPSVNPTPPSKETHTYRKEKQEKENIKQQQQAVAVVSSNQESLALLKQLGFDDKTALSLTKFPLDRISRQIENLHRQQEITDIDNPLGWLRTAIENNWQSPEPKEDFAEKAALLRRAQLEERTMVKNECIKLYDQYENLFQVNKYFDIGIDVVSCKSGDRYFQCAYDEQCLIRLNRFIQENFK